MVVELIVLLDQIQFSQLSHQLVVEREVLEIVVQLVVQVVVELTRIPDLLVILLL